MNIVGVGCASRGLRRGIMTTNAVAKSIRKTVEEKPSVNRDAKIGAATKVNLSKANICGEINGVVAVAGARARISNEDDVERAVKINQLF